MNHLNVLIPVHPRYCPKSNPLYLPSLSPSQLKHSFLLFQIW